MTEVYIKASMSSKVLARDSEYITRVPYIKFQDDLLWAAGMLGCSIDILPTVYLGLSLGAKSRSRDIWKGVIRNVKNKLVPWKSRILFKGGRITFFLIFHQFIICHSLSCL